MSFDEVANKIDEFWNKKDDSWNENKAVFSGGGQTELSRIQRLFNKEIPKELGNYILDMAPDKDFYFRMIGNDICIYSYKNLSNKVDGYSYNSITKEDINDWNEDWFLIGDEGGDPIIVDLSCSGNNAGKCPVLQAMHGGGVWEFYEISSSISQFLICASYLHHALIGFDIVEPVIYKDDRIYLVDEVAEWFFPKVKECDPENYETWTLMFENKIL